VWVTYQLIGATQAAQVHDIARRTVYRCVEDVEGNETTLAAARARLDAQREQREARLAAVTDAAVEALVARIKSGRVHTRYLVGLVAPQGAKTSGPGKVALEVPTFMTTPRETSTAEGES
jgi:hypothetical protein